MSGTGWTWAHVQHECDLPTYFALCEWWREVPPPAVQLRRIAMALGIKENAQPGTPRMAEPSEPSTAEEVSMAALSAGLPVFQGRPNDSVFDFIPPAPSL